MRVRDLHDTGHMHPLDLGLLKIICYTISSLWFRAFGALPSKLRRLDKPLITKPPDHSKYILDYVFLRARGGFHPVHLVSHLFTHASSLSSPLPTSPPFFSGSDSFSQESRSVSLFTHNNNVSIVIIIIVWIEASVPISSPLPRASSCIIFGLYSGSISLGKSY